MYTIIAQNATVSIRQKISKGRFCFICLLDYWEQRVCLLGQCLAGNMNRPSFED